jgi:hypothetical protein
MQLHRDSTVNQIVLQTTVEGGVIKYQDSPLLRGIRLGRIVVVDEADKAVSVILACYNAHALDEYLRSLSTSLLCSGAWPRKERCLSQTVAGSVLRMSVREI